MKLAKKSSVALTCIAGGLLLAPLTAGAVDAKVYGQVAYSLRWLDDNAPGDQSSENIDFIRNGFSETRFGFIASEDIGGGLTAGANIEMGIAEGAGAAAARQQSFYLQGAFGTVRLGHHYDVGDGTMNADMAGTSVANPLTSRGTAHGISGYGGFDPDRGEALRYYSPKLGGAGTVAVQLQEDGAWEVAARFNVAGVQINGFYEDIAEVKNAAGAVTTASQDKIGLLVGYKFPFGLNLTATRSEHDLGTQAGGTDKYTAVKIGYQIGSVHHVSVSSSKLEDGAATPAKDKETIGASYLAKVSKQLSLYAAYLDADDNVDGTTDPKAYIFGGIFKF